MAGEPTSGRCRRRRWAGPKVAVTAPPPPSGAVTANLRGSPTALRARWDSRGRRGRASPPTVVVRASGHGSDCATVHVLDVHLAGPAPPAPVPDEDLVVLAHRSRRLRRALPPLRAPGAPSSTAAALPSWPRRSPRPRSSGPCAPCPASVGATVASRPGSTASRPTSWPATTARRSASTASGDSAPPDSCTTRPSPAEPALDGGDGPGAPGARAAERALPARHQPPLPLGPRPRGRGPRHGAEQGHVRGGAAPGHGGASQGDRPADGRGL